MDFREELLRFSLTYVPHSVLGASVPEKGSQGEPSVHTAFHPHRSTVSGELPWIRIVLTWVQDQG